MSLTATYNGDLSRVQLSATALGVTATYAVVERALDAGVTDAMWAAGTVRGGTRLPVESEAAELDDFEFFSGVPNHYRITSFDDSDVQQEQFTTSLTPDLDGQVWLKSVNYPLLNRPVRLRDQAEPIDRSSRSEVEPVAGRAVGVGSHDLRLGRQFTLHLLTVGPDHLDEAGKWDVILTAGTLWFVHVPAGSRVPGGYVAIGDTSARRLYRGSNASPWTIELPCTVQAAPAPQVTGTLLIAETVFRLYSSANALFAAHSTGRSLLATIGDPDDLVVI